MNIPHNLSSSQDVIGRRGKLIVIEGIDGSGKTVQARLLMERLLKEDYQVQMTDFPQYGKSFFADMIERYLRGEFGWTKELRDHLEKYPLPGKKSHASDQSLSEQSPKNTRTTSSEPSPDEVNPYLTALLYAGDRWEMKEEMNKWLNEGYIIISNRYVCSNEAHQGAKLSDNVERCRFFKWLEELEYKKFAIPRPDLVIYLHVPIEISQDFIKAKVQSEKGFKSEIDMHEKDIGYLERVQNMYLKLAREDNDWFTIECSKNNQILSREKIAEKIWNIINKVINKNSSLC